MAAGKSASRLCILCPITTQVKGYPFETLIPPGLAVSGAVLADQVKSLSWTDRNALFIDTMPEPVMVEVRARIRALIWPKS